MKYKSLDNPNTVFAVCEKAKAPFSQKAFRSLPIIFCALHISGCNSAYDNASAGKTIPTSIPTVSTTAAPKKAEPAAATPAAESSDKNNVGQSAAISKAIEANPLDSDSYFKLGLLERQSKNREKAVADLKKTIELRPEHFEAHMNLAYVYAEMRRYTESLAEFTTATKLRPNSSGAWEGRAWVLNEFKRFNEAAESANKAIELDPKTTGNCREFLAGAYNSQQKYDLALKAANAGIKVKPNSDWLIEMRAEAEEHLGEFLPAIKDYKKAIEMNPKAWTWLYPNLVSCYDRYLKEKDPD